MREISDISILSDKSILTEIGNFIARRRVQKQITQAELAKKTALSRSTVSLMERGESISLNNLLKILRILDSLYVLHSFVVPEKKSPMALAKEEHMKKARRVSRRKDFTADKEDLGW